MKATLPKNTWQLQDAKNQFSRVVDRALATGAQTITRHGKPVAVVVSQEEFTRLVPAKTPRKSFGEFLLSFPKVEPDGLVIERSREPVRDISFD